MTTAIDTHTNTHTEYVILIASPLQEWLGKRAPGLRYTYIACLVSFVCVCMYVCVSVCGCVCVCGCGGEDSERTAIQIRECHKQTPKNCVQRY